jgi:hypothetical protein
LSSESTAPGSTGFPSVIAYIMIAIIVLCLGGIGYLIFLLKRANAKEIIPTDTVMTEVKIKSEPIELLKP